MDKKMTTRELARLAGVSPAAVSFALNGKDGISPETRQKILNIARQVDYSPKKQSATRLNRIAVIFHRDIQPMDMLFYTELNTIVMQACSARGIDMLVTQMQIVDGEVRLPNCLLCREVDGVLVYGDISRTYLARLKALDIPVVELDSSRSYEGQVAVRVNYRRSAQLATEHLLEQGHRDIAYIGNEELHDFNLQVFSGFQDAISKAGHPLDLSRVQLNVRDKQTVYRAVDALLSSPTRPTAIFCATDLYAVYAMEYMQRKGLKIPEDISIMGIDDIEISAFTTPALTTVRVDREELGRQGFDLLMRCIAEGHQQSIVLEPTQLIHRGSTMEKIS